MMYRISKIPKELPFVTTCITLCLLTNENIETRFVSTLAHMLNKHFKRDTGTLLSTDKSS